MSSYIRNSVNYVNKPIPASQKHHRPSLSSLSKSGQSNKQNCKKSSMQGPGKFFSFKDPVHKKSSSNTEISRRELSQLEMMISKTDNSMQQILSSSIKQLENMLRPISPSQSLEQENMKLRGMLGKMEILLKDKLESALQKQRGQVSKMVSDYISLITKLLQDKQSLSCRIEALQFQNQRYQNMTKQHEQSIKKLIDYKNQQLISANEQIQRLKTQQTNSTLYQTSSKSSIPSEISHQTKQLHCSIIKDCESDKIQLDQIIRIMEAYQKQNNQLKLQISRMRLIQIGESQNSISYDKLKQIQEAFKKQLIDIQKNHDLEFQEYEAAIKDTIAKKNQCIEKLNFIIEDLRSRKKLN